MAWKNIEERRKYHREYARKWRENNKEKLLVYIQKWRLKNKDWTAENHRKNWVKARRLVIEHYSNGKNYCNCCGEKEFAFLSIDHINGGGHQHRKMVKSNIVRWLIRNNYPEGYQILCYNCNMAKAYYGQCPHKNT